MSLGRQTGAAVRKCPRADLAEWDGVDVYSLDDLVAIGWKNPALTGPIR
jgi:hypothetical protein